MPAREALSRRNPAALPPPYRKILVLAAAAALLRLAAIAWVPTQPVSDFWSYFERAGHLAFGGREAFSPGHTDSDHPPLYPLLLAGALRLAGSKSLFAAKLVNVALGTASVAIAGVGTGRLWGARPGVAAAILLAVFPRSILMCCLIASENLFTPLLLLFVFLVVEAARSARIARVAAAAGAALGLLALTRTVAYLFGVLWIASTAAGRRRLPAVLGGFVIVLAAQHLVMLPWALRNARRIDRFTFLSTGGGYGLFLGNNPNATGDWYDGRADLERAAPGAFSRGRVAASEAASREAWRWMRANPGAAAALYVRKIGLIFRQSYIVADFAVSGRDIGRPPGADALPGAHVLKTHILAVKRSLALAAWGLVALGAAGFVVLLARIRRHDRDLDRAAALVFFLAAAYIPLTSALIAVNGRYRWPVEDLLIPPAALALAALGSRRRESRAPSPG